MIRNALIFFVVYIKFHHIALQSFFFSIIFISCHQCCHSHDRILLSLSQTFVAFEVWHDAFACWKMYFSYLKSNHIPKIIFKKYYWTLKFIFRETNVISLIFSGQSNRKDELSSIIVMADENGSILISYFLISTFF